MNLSFTCDIKPNLNLSYCTQLSLASVLNVLSHLYDYSGGTAHAVAFNLTFTDDEAGTLAAAVTAAQAKNWTVAGLTINAYSA
jgi:hypothetical protein